MTPLLQSLSKLVSLINHEAVASEQMQKIVDAITDMLNVDVTTVYRCEPDGDLVMLASHGLVTSSHPVRIPAGKGLVGLAVQSLHPINLADASEHPDYFYIPSTEEEKFHGFCAVPLVRLGKVVGALVVQTLAKEKLSEDCEAFLMSLALHLAAIVQDVNLSPSIVRKNRRIEGVIGAPGVAVGKARLLHEIDLRLQPEQFSGDPEQEKANWFSLREAAIESIEKDRLALKDDISDAVSGIFDAYQMLLGDTVLSDSVIGYINNGFSLLTSIKKAIDYLAGLFEEMEDPYLRARAEDLVQLGDKLIHVWKDQYESPASQKITEPVILVGKQIGASHIAHIPKAYLAGIVCALGSAMSHTSVLANALGIPAIMGIGDAIRFVENGDNLVLDAYSGELILEPTKAIFKEYQKILDKDKKRDASLLSLVSEPSVTLDQSQIELLVNIGLSTDIKTGQRNGAKGVGLYRTEIPFMSQDSFPTEDEQVASYKKVFDGFSQGPVYLRTLDIGGDKQLPYFPIENEENPALGWRGLRFCLDNLPLLMTQIRSVLKASCSHSGVHVLIPMVTSLGEILAVKQLFKDAIDQLNAEKIEVTMPRLGIMVEVPAVISQLHGWREHLDFISIGSNDLSQYLLALDRNNPLVAKHYDHVHPAVLNEIKRVVDTANSLDLPVSLCGEMASDPVAVLFLIGMGIKRLSVSPSKLLRIKWLVRSVRRSELQTLVDQLPEYASAADIREMGEVYLQAQGLGELVH